MKDFLGNELNVGDVVIITEPKYRNFVVATIKGFTKKFVNLTYNPCWAQGGMSDLKQSPDQMIKLPKQ